MDRTVYLAGGIAGLTYEEATFWREVATEYLNQFGVRTLSPMRHKEFLRGNGPITAERYDQTIATDKGIVSRDRHDIMQCDLVLVNFCGAGHVSVGTPTEFGWADAFRKPIITVIEAEDNPYDHPFIRELSSYRVETLDEGLYFAITVLGG